MPVTATLPTVNTACTGFNAGTATTLATGVALSALPTTYATGLGGTVVPVGTQYVTYQFTYTVDQHWLQRWRQRTAVVQRCRGLQLGNPVSLTV